MSTTKELFEIEVALAKKERLTDKQVVKIAELRRQHNVEKSWIGIKKLALRPGEELWDFVTAMCNAVSTNRVILADGSLDAWLHGIFEDHVIVQDGNTGKFFKSGFIRNSAGEFEFSDPVEVMPVFVPVDGAADDAEKSVTKRAPEPVDMLDVSKSTAPKWSFIPRSLRSVKR